MSTQIVAKPENTQIATAIESVLIQGDLSRLTPAERVVYYNRVCESMRLNPLTQPLEYLTFQGKLTLYCRRNCTDQLRQIHSISVKIVSRERIGDLLVVTAQASTPDGRADESIGAVFVGSQKGQELANLMMKCETKAKRRVTLSICGLSFMDESEVEDTPGKKQFHGTDHPHTDQAAKALQPNTTNVVQPNSNTTNVVSAEYTEADDLDVKIKIARDFVKIYGAPRDPHKGKALKDIPLDALAKDLAYWDNRAKEQGITITGPLKEQLDNIRLVMSAGESIEDQIPF